MKGYKTVAEIFSQISGIYDKFLETVSAGHIHKWQRELIEGLNREGNWLDVGTGTCEVLKKLGKDFKGVKVGIDPAFGMLKVACSKCPDCYFIQALAENLPFKGKTFKNISLSLVFRHLQNKLKFLEEAHRVLDKEGRIGILDVGKFKGTPVVAFLMKTFFRPLGHLIFGKDKWDFFIHSVEESFSPEEVKDMLEVKGFKVEKISKKWLGLVYIITAVKIE